MRKALGFASLFTFTCGCWLAPMECILRHPGYIMRVGVAFCILLVSVATICVLKLHLGYRSERWLWAGAAALIAIGVQAFIHNARSVHFEGFVFLISLALVLQGLMMAFSLGRPEGGQFSA